MCVVLFDELNYNDRIYYSLELTLLPPYTGSPIGSPPSVCGSYTVVSGDPALCPLVGSSIANSEEWRQARDRYQVACVSLLEVMFPLR